MKPLGSALASQLDRHRYFLSWPDASHPVVELANDTWTPGMLPEIRYPLALLVKAALHLNTGFLHFYFTKDPSHLPEYGPHVVAVLLLEERCKVPAYGRHVRAVVRNMQTHPFLGFTPSLRVGPLETVLVFEYVRDCALYRRSLHHLARFHSDASSVVAGEPRIIHIPLGYHSQNELPVLPMKDRSLDTFFAGDVRSKVPATDYRHWTSTSKIQARKQLYRVLNRLRAQPEWRIEWTEMSGPQPSLGDATFASYSEKMQNSRICVAPRGSMAETYRLHEGLRAGCLVVTNPLPPMDYLAGAPILIIENWAQLPGILHQYARNVDKLEALSAAGRHWWYEHCGEESAGKTLAARLNSTVAPC